MLTSPLCLRVLSGASFTKPQHVRVQGLSEQYGEDASHTEVCRMCLTRAYRVRLNVPTLRIK